MRNYFILVIFLLPTLLLAQNTESCTEAWCFDKKGNYKEGVRFNSSSIHWPLHFTGETVKNEDWILVRYEHHGKVDIVSLKEYRSLTNNPSFCEDGLSMNQAFECKVEHTEKPTFQQTSCSMVGISKEEKEIRIGEGSCIKKIIDWTIIDWCLYDPKTDDGKSKDDLFLVKDLVDGVDYYTYSSAYGKVKNDGSFHYRQVIKIGDATQPVILHNEKKIISLGKDCMTSVTIGNRATDEGECPSNGLKWTVTLRSTGARPEILEHEVIGEDSVSVLLEDLEAGEYQILWRVKDACNNPQEEKTVIIVKDNSAPHIICKGSLSVGVGSPGDPVQIWANDLVKYVSDNCTLDSDVLLSFSPDEHQTSLDLTCEEYFGEAVFNVYATDDEGNQSYCEVKSRLSSADPECMRTVNLNGTVQDENGTMLRHVSLSVNYNNQQSVVYTDATGSFSFKQDIPLNANVTIALQQDVLSGKVSTTDLVTIQKHVMNVEKITNMYRLSAADIDNDGKVKTNDVKLLRQYLLGILSYDQYMGNKLMDMDSRQSGAAITIGNTDVVRLAVIVNGDVVENNRSN